MAIKSVDELALELIELHKIRPPIAHPNPDNSSPKGDAYKNHMHEEYLLEEEIYRRIGVDHGNERIQKMRNILDLLT